MSSSHSAAHSPDSPIHHPPGFRRRRGRNWFLLGLTYASYYFCRYNLGPVSPELMRELSLSPSQYGWIQTGRNGAYAIGQMVNGLFTDRLGGKRAMTIGGIGTIAMNLLFAAVAWTHSSNLSFLFVGLLIIRMCDGYFQSFGAPGFIKINTSWFQRKERGSFAGIFGAMINIGSTAAPHLAKYLSTGLSISLVFFTLNTPKLDWRYVFVIPPVFVGLMLVFLNLFVKATPEEAGFKMNHEGEPQQPDDGTKIKLMDVFRKIASNRVVWFVAGAYFCTGFVRSSIEQWWAKYLEDVWHAGKSSYAFEAFSIGIPVTATLGSMASGYVSDRFFRGQRAQVAAFLYLTQTILTIAAIFVPVGGAWAAGMAIFLIISVATVCNSTHSILGTAAAMDLGGPKMAGCSSGIIDSFQYYGAMLAGGGLGLLFERLGKSPHVVEVTTMAAKAGSKILPHTTAPLNVTAWLGTMIPFGMLGTGLMTYVWWTHRGTDTRGA